MLLAREDHLVLVDLVLAAHRSTRAEFVSLTASGERRQFLEIYAATIFKCEVHSVGENLVIVADNNSRIPD